MRIIHVTNDELYEMVKLYDLLRDMDFELTENQINVFDKVLTMEGKSHVTNYSQSANINATNSELDAKQIITHKENNKEKSNNERSEYCEGEFIPNFHD